MTEMATAEALETQEQKADNHQVNPIVKRPILPSKPKKRSSLRLSFGPGETGAEDGDDDSSRSVFTPKKSNLSRLAIEKNAERKSLRTSLSSEHLPFRAAGVSEDRPSYSKDYLAELRKSTPSTPKNLKSTAMSEWEDNRAIDIASKFGPLAALASMDSTIPTEAEIREKKERRAQLAREQQGFMSLDGDGDDNLGSDDEDPRNEITLRPKEKYPETRLVREDEDIAEGFDNFVEDEKISLGRKAEREAEKKRRADMANLIAEAEGGSADDGSDDSEAERNAAYEAAQTRAGTYGRADRYSDEAQGLKTPSRITPLPELDTVVARLQSALKSMEDTKARKMKRMEELRTEKIEIAEREIWIQMQLKETGEKYEKLRIEAGFGGGAVTPLNGADGTKMIVNRGLESLGATPVTARDDSSDE
ncbi:hypothetical protein K432DRAFT_418329 [Lepidopterella palustris CBS 459.81]|uniref:Uncharacterized protein n=1 Tax=Lepidopterella palustris CBS 459.81 TaxID=1314670 RepID=A0A8E2E665_9PEZI|nr:hypothetical protein K432DRAFT_418329 [Lepidopterella palustris CBS 459.81]